MSRGAEGTPANPSRRSVLRLAAALGGATLAVPITGCQAIAPGVRRTPRPATPDELAVERAAIAAVGLRDAALALATAQPRVASLLRRVAAEHDEHLRALGVTDPAAVIATTTPSPVRPDAEGLRDAEWAGARGALRDALDAGPGPAALLARVAAARVLHADAVADAVRSVGAPPARLDPADAVSPEASGGTTSPGARSPEAPSAGATARQPSGSAGTAADGLSRDAQEALGRLLAGEHAAVFAYPLVVGRCATGDRKTAQALWQAHVADRDALERLLVSGGAEPPAPAAAYDVGPLPEDARAAARLAAVVETRLAALAVPAVAATGGAARLVSARTLVTSSRRAAAWGASPGALPGGTTPA